MLHKFVNHKLRFRRKGCRASPCFKRKALGSALSARRAHSCTKEVKSAPKMVVNELVSIVRNTDVIQNGNYVQGCRLLPRSLSKCFTTSADHKRNLADIGELDVLIKMGTPPRMKLLSRNHCICNSLNHFARTGIGFTISNRMPCCEQMDDNHHWGSIQG